MALTLLAAAVLVLAAGPAFPAMRAGGDPAPSPPTPACAGPAAHRLDFWIGEWEVKNPSGGLEGHNRIEKVLGGCAILEHWTEADGSEGKSLFYFDALGGRWKQVWATDGGQFKEKAEVPLEVSAHPEAIRFQGEIPLRSGRRLQDRTTLTALPDGRVRQLIEQSADGGATWRAWEGLYTRAMTPRM